MNKILIGVCSLGAILVFSVLTSSQPSTPKQEKAEIIESVINNLNNYNDANTSLEEEIRYEQLKEEPIKCHSSYSGCLKPDASDYDCIGGSGNGPYYTGKVRVIGPDVFGLDRDKDGWGCE